MNDTQPNDVFATLRDSFANVRMEVPLESVIAAGRARRGRRWLAAGGTTAAAVVAAVGAVVLVGPGNATNEAQPAGPGTAVHVHLAAWSVDSSGDGTVALDVRELADAARLQATLADAGVPAIVNADPRCQAVGGDHLPEIGQVVSHGVAPGGAVALTIKPSAMPKGAKLVFDVDLAAPGDVVPPNTTAQAHARPTLTATSIWLGSAGTSLTCGSSSAPSTSATHR
jgi:hypothetical protein